MTLSLTVDGMLGDLSAGVSAFVEERHGSSEGGVWRIEPIHWREFVTSKGHLDLPPIYDGPQADAMDALLGADPKRMFEEPGARAVVKLQWARVRSSNVKGVAWHDGQLYVWFKSDVAYRYPEVSRATFELVLQAKSKGKAIAATIAGHKGYEKLDVSPVDVEVLADWDGRLYQVAVLLWGKGSGKDYLSSIIVTYLVYVLLCLRDPQSYLELAPGENIDIVNVAYNADQAKRVFFSKLKARVERWKWLTDNFNVVESGRRKNVHVAGRQEVQINDDHIEFPRKIRAWSRHSQNESFEGLNVIAWVMDEASAFLSAIKRENAEKIFSTLSTSASTRFKRRWIGMIISFPRHGDDFTMTKLAEAVRHPELGMYASGPFKTWEVNKMLGKGEWVEVRPGHRVPVELAAQYQLLGFEEALAKFECDPPSAVDALFKFPDRLWDAVKKGKPSLIEWHPIVTSYEVGGPDGKPRKRQYVGVKVTNWGKRLPRGSRMFFHGDPALTTDGFALAIAHPVPATVMTYVPASEVMTAEQIARAGIDPEKIVQWERDVFKTVVDALIVWQPDPKLGRQVDLVNVKETLMELRKYHRIEAGTFDNWGFFEAIQQLQRLKMNVENEMWGNPLQLSMYTNGRSAFYNDLVELPDTPTITSKDPTAPGALYELERVQLIEARKIDHPQGGSKDLGDAVMRVIKHVTEFGQKGGLHWTTAFGHKGAYGDDYAPSGRRAQDPEATPTPVNQTLKEAEERRAIERPLGEVTPRDHVGTRRITAEEAEKLKRREKPRAAGKLGFGSVRR